jgi:hypothetical protein
MYACYTPFVSLLGEDGKKHWEANVDLHKYLFSALALTEEYDTNWDVSARTD